MQLLEIFHPLFGYTKGGLLEPVVQGNYLFKNKINAYILINFIYIKVGGRGIILFALIESEARIQTKPVIFYLILCWSIIELFRYFLFLLSPVLCAFI